MVLVHYNQASTIPTNPTTAVFPTPATSRCPAPLNCGGWLVVADGNTTTIVPLGGRTTGGVETPGTSSTAGEETPGTAGGAAAGGETSGGGGAIPGVGVL
jgi:hypothetical protein